MLFRSSLLALLLLLSPSAAAQSPPSPACELGTATGELAAAGARATLLTTGQLFEFSSGYEVPKGSGVSPIYSTSLMIGGLVGGEVRFAGSTYGPAEFWPGPLAADGTTTPAQCAAYDRIWVVGTADLAAFDATGTATADLADWPVRVGAPFYVDGNGNGQQDDTEPTVALDAGDPGYGTRTIDLAAGERPVVFGRQTAWWVMNDAGGPHEWSANDGEAYRQPIGIEVRVTAWAHGGEAEPALSESTFYRFEVINRSTASLETAHAGLHIDGDLGNATDDRVGADSTRQMIVFYNGGEVDHNGYGALPPALGIDALSGAWAGTAPYKGGGAHGEPYGALNGYNTLRGLWRDGSPVRVGGFGYDTDGPVTRWAFSGDMVAGAFWSQENIDGAGTDLTPSDKKGLISSLPADLAPGERLVFDVAILFATGQSRLESVAELRAVSDQAQTLYNGGALTVPVTDPAAPPAPVLVAPADGEDVAEGALSFTWQPVPGAQGYRFEISETADGSGPLVSDYARQPGVDIDPQRLPVNRRAPLYWRVSAVALGVAGPPSEAQSFTAFRPGFDRFSVVANAAGPLTPPVAFTYPQGWDPSAQTDGGQWALRFEDAPVGSAAAAAYPNDYEIRFILGDSGPAEAVRTSDGARVTVPFELWDIGVGTPDDRSDDIRLIPVIKDLDEDGNPPRETTFAWYRPERMVPGKRGYRAWAHAAALPDAARQVLPPSFFESWSSAAPGEWPERGTVVRLESSAQALAVATPGAGEALALEVRPNPTATRATVAYRLMAPGPVRLTVVDVLGREVTVLAEGDRPEGEHHAALDASALAPGVYMLVLRAGDTRAVRTITVAR